MKIKSHSVSDTLKIGRAIARNLKPPDIICLFGELGSGKTVLTKGIAEGLRIKRDKVSSPSFILMRQYPLGRLALNHFDLYRLNNPGDILALGYQEYLYGEGVSVIEWADRLKYLLPQEYLKVELNIKGNKQRALRFSACGARYRELLEKIREDIRH